MVDRAGHVARRSLVHSVVRIAYLVGFVVAAATACGDKSPDAIPRRYKLAMEVEVPALAAELTLDVDRGVALIERFFQAPFGREFVFHVFADRADGGALARDVPRSQPSFRVLDDR